MPGLFAAESQPTGLAVARKSGTRRTSPLESAQTGAAKIPRAGHRKLGHSVRCRGGPEACHEDPRRVFPWSSLIPIHTRSLRIHDCFGSVAKDTAKFCCKCALRP